MLLMLPILPEDEPQRQAAFATLSEEETRLRSYGTMKTLFHVRVARVTQLDDDREMALF